MASRSIVLRCFISVGLLNACIKGFYSIDLSLGFTALSPAEVIAQRNQPLSLNCSGYSGSEYEPLRIRWLHQGIEIKDGRRQVLANGTLHIKRVLHQKKKKGKRDDGNYTCVLQNNVGVLYSRPIHVVVARMAQTFSLEPQPATAAQGGDARFMCQIHAVPPAVITWQQNGEDIPENSSRHIYLPSGVLQINDLSSSDAGGYRCIASNAGRVLHSQEAMLTVTDVNTAHHLEFLNSVNQPIIKLAKDTAILECLAQGYSPPEVSWSRQDGKPLPSQRTKILGKGNLVISPVKPEDAGVYVCNASNIDVSTGTAHSVVQHLTLVVYVPPDFLTRPVSKVKPTAQTARFECIVDGIPTPTVKWIKNGQPLYINGRIKVKAGNVLVISQTVTSDSGIYQCFAENAAGTNSAAARLQVNTSSNQPDPPKGLKARTLSSTSILLTWKAASSPSGFNIQAYTVHYLPASGGIEIQNVAVNTSQVIDKLKPYTNYTFYVRAYNGRSASEQSDIIIHMTGEDIPIGAPAVTLSSQSSTTLHVSWDDLPNDVARGVIVAYRIHYRKHGVASYSVIDIDGTIKEYTITGLQPKRKYDVRVMGATKIGFPSLTDEEWPWVTHEMPDAATAKAPLPPILHLTVLNVTTLEVKWRMPPENRYAIEGFRLTYRKQNQALQSPIDLPANTSKFLLVSLAPQTWYEVHVYSYNSLGNGHESVRNILTLPADHPDVETVEVVDPPQHLEADPKSSTSIQLLWEAPITDKNITYYTVRYHPVTTSTTNSTALSYLRSTNNEVILTDLVPFTLYEFAVRSHDINNKQGPFSQKVECKTLEDIPSSPQDLTWTIVDAQSIRLNWRPPKYPNGIITTYYILYNTHMEDMYCLDSWQTKEENGTERTSVVKDLASNTEYFFCMRAETKAGTGPPSPLISLRIPVWPQEHNGTKNAPNVLRSGPHDPFLGVVLGISIGVGCIIICALIIMCRNRCSPVNDPIEAHYSTCCANGHVQHRNGHLTVFSGPREKRASGSDCQEPDSFTPMLTHLPSNLTEHHIDTKGGYTHTVCNGHVIGFSYPLLPNGNLENGGCNAKKNTINITENPQCAASGTTAYIPADQNGQCRAATNDRDAEDCCSTTDDFPDLAEALLNKSSGDGQVGIDSVNPVKRNGCNNHRENQNGAAIFSAGESSNQNMGDFSFSTSSQCADTFVEENSVPPPSVCNPLQDSVGVLNTVTSSSSSNVPSLFLASSQHSQELLVTPSVSNALLDSAVSSVPAQLAKCKDTSLSEDSGMLMADTCSITSSPTKMPSSSVTCNKVSQRNHSTSTSCQARSPV